MQTPEPKMQLAKRFTLPVTLLVLLGLDASCGRKVSPPTSPPEATNPGVATPAQPATRVMAPSTAPALQSALAAAQTASRSQDYTNPIQHFDALRSSGQLTGDQLGRIQDAEARLMRELAAKAAAGDENALRQFRALSDRPRGGAR